MIISPAAEITKRGIAAYNIGDKATAAAIFGQAIQVDTTYEMAWLWLSSCVSTDTERQYCLERALTVNPESIPARKGLAQLPRGTPTPPSVVLASQPLMALPTLPSFSSAPSAIVSASLLPNPLQKPPTRMSIVTWIGIITISIIIVGLVIVFGIISIRSYQEARVRQVFATIETGLESTEVLVAVPIASSNHSLKDIAVALNKQLTADNIVVEKISTIEGSQPMIDISYTLAGNTNGQADPEISRTITTIARRVTNQIKVGALIQRAKITLKYGKTAITGVMLVTAHDLLAWDKGEISDDQLMGYWLWDIQKP